MGIRLTKELQGLKHCNPTREGEVKGALDKWRNILIAHGLEDPILPRWQFFTN